MKSPKYLLSKKEVAHALSVSPGTVSNLVKAGLLSDPIKVSQVRVAWRVEDVEAYVQRITKPA